MEVEFLIGDQSLERVILLYQPSLQRLGIHSIVRYVDDAQYFNRLREWDFDIILRLARDAHAGQRAKRLLGLECRRHTRLSQSH